MVFLREVTSSASRPTDRPPISGRVGDLVSPCFAECGQYLDLRHGGRVNHFILTGCRGLDHRQEPLKHHHEMVDLSITDGSGGIVIKALPHFTEEVDPKDRRV